MKINVYITVNPGFTVQKWGLRGSKLYRRVSVMQKLVSKVNPSNVSVE